MSFPTIPRGARSISVTADRTITPAECAGLVRLYLMCDSTAAAFTVTMPSPAALSAPLSLVFLDVAGTATANHVSFDMTGGGTLRFGAGGGGTIVLPNAFAGILSNGAASELFLDPAIPAFCQSISFTS